MHKAPAAPGQPVVEQQMGKSGASNRHRDAFELGEVSKGNFSRVVAEREDHLWRPAVQRLPVPHPALQTSLVGNPVHIWLLLMQMLKQSDRHQCRFPLQQRLQQAVPHLLQRVRSGAPAGLASLGLEGVFVDTAGTAHLNPSRCSSHFLAAAGSSFGHVEAALVACQ